MHIKNNSLFFLPWHKQTKQPWAHHCRRTQNFSCLCDTHSLFGSFNLTGLWIEPHTHTLGPAHTFNLTASNKSLLLVKCSPVAAGICRAEGVLFKDICEEKRTHTHMHSLLHWHTPALNRLHTRWGVSTLLMLSLFFFIYHSISLLLLLVLSTGLRDWDRPRGDFDDGFPCLVQRAHSPLQPLAHRRINSPTPTPWDLLKLLKGRSDVSTNPPDFIPLKALACTRGTFTSACAPGSSHAVSDAISAGYFAH